MPDLKCEQTKVWVEEQVEKPVEKLREEWTQQCHVEWWNPLSWFCWLVLHVLYVVVWITVTVGKWVTQVFCYVVTVLTEILEPIVSVVLGLLDALLELFFSIPIFGRLARQGLSFFQDLLWRLTGVLDTLLGAAGARPEKKLRLCVIILRDEQKNEVVKDHAEVLRQIQAMIDIYAAEANVRVIAAKPLGLFTSANAPARETADESYIHVVEEAADAALLDLSGDSLANYIEDLTVQGAQFNMRMTRYCFWGNARRLIGYGAPVTAFVIRSIGNGKINGVTIPLVSDYFAVVMTNTPVATAVGGTEVDHTAIAHEAGHCCGILPHWDDPVNLMYGTDSNSRRKMTPEQVLLIRSSKHVTYF